MNARALALVAAGGERLLELVDREHDAPVAVDAVAAASRQLAQRVLARADEHLLPVARCRAARRPPARAAARRA